MRVGDRKADAEAAVMGAASKGTQAAAKGQTADSALGPPDQPGPARPRETADVQPRERGKLCRSKPAFVATGQAATGHRPRVREKSPEAQKSSSRADSLPGHLTLFSQIANKEITYTKQVTD